ncbi:MAG: bacterial transcriptional activator domain-containing protein [Deltaproteobacteria bacterium]|nr:bacterial transcriptional activator domain-containing protein [Deltaproteobacteria bacterium]
MIALLILALAAGSLDDAEAALQAGEHERCGELAQQALAAGELDERGVTRAWLLRGRCYALAGERDRAERSYAVAVRTSPDVATWIAGGAPQGEGEAFAAALAARGADPLRATALVVQDHVVVTLVADDLVLVRGASLWRADEELARVPLELGAAATHQVGGIGTEGLTLVLHDRHGNVVWRGPVERAAVKHDEGKGVVVEGGAPAREPTVLTAIGGGALALGLVGAVVCGIGASSDRTTTFETGGPWLVGVAAATGVFLVGAGLVVVDQGL